MKPKALWILWAVAIIGGGLAPARISASAMKVRLPNGLYVTKEVVSLREARYQNIVPQKLDLSCGAASLATILNYYYNDTVDETEIIEVMLESGDRAKIAEKGFSLLDLKRYAERNDYMANGYRAEVENLRDLNIPGIILLNSRKYNHFVVLKGIKGRKVYVADPASGNRSMSVKDFEKEWNGVIFLVVNKKKDGAVSELELQSTIPAPMMSVISVQALSAGRFSFTQMKGEF